MTQVTALPIASSAPHDWWRRVSTVVNLLLGEVADLYARPTREINANYTAQDGDYGFIADATNGPITVTLPTPTKGRELVAKKVDASGNAVTLSGAIDGAASKQLTSQWQSVRLYGNGDQWLVM